MPDGTLYLGNRRYSSWSLRGWLAVRLAGFDVDEVVLPMTGTNQTASIAAVSPSGLVPYLEHQVRAVWETLAIFEYCAEFVPALWPAELTARTRARVIAAEMHAGFRGLRNAMPMNLGRDFSGRCRTPDALADIARIERIWAETRDAFGAGGPYLFGATFTATDAMFAPVVARLLGYRPEITEATRAYCDAVRAHPLMDEWYRLAAAEPPEWLIPKYEDPGA